MQASAPPNCSNENSTAALSKRLSTSDQSDLSSVQGVLLKVTEAYCGKGMVMKRWRARAKGRPGRINKFLTNVTIKVSEDQVKEVKKEKAK